MATPAFEEIAETLGVPIATVDGLPSTPALWAALLVDCGRAAALCEEDDTRVERVAPIVLEDPRPSGPVTPIFPRVPSQTSVDR